MANVTISDLSSKAAAATDELEVQATAAGASYKVTVASLLATPTQTLVTPALGVATATSINKVAITAPNAGATLTIADGKTLTVSNILTLAGTDSTTMTFPTTSATVARTDAANTFTGIQTIGALIATSVNGNTVTTGTGALTLGAKTLTVSKTLTLDGTDSTTMTFPTTSATIARTDAANSFTGTQTVGALVVTTVNGNSVPTTTTGTLGLAAAGTAPVDAVAATAAISTSGVDVSAADGVIINGKTYTFVTPVGVTEGNILIGGSSDASLTNLINAINHAGTPDTDYVCAAAHTTVTASVLGVNTFTLTAKTKGALGNAYSMSKSNAVTLTVPALFTNGVDGMPGVAGQIIVAGGAQPYICLAASTTASTGTWKKLAVEAL